MIPSGINLFPDSNMMEFSWEHLGTDSWEDVYQDIRKAFNKNNWRKTSIPTWSDITKEDYY